MRLNLDFFAYSCCNRKSKIFRYLITKTFPHNLTGILHRKFDLEILVPVRIWLQFTLSYPPGIVFVDIFGLEVMHDVEFFQSGPDCEKFVSSLRVEPYLPAKVVDSLGLDPRLTTQLKTAGTLTVSDLSLATATQLRTPITASGLGVTAADLKLSATTFITTTTPPPPPPLSRL